MINPIRFAVMPVDFAKAIQFLAMAGVNEVSCRDSMYGCPVSHLVHEVFRAGVPKLMDRLIEQLTEVNGSFEYRLNGAGLKLYGHLHRSGLIECTVWGDQAESYSGYMVYLAKHIRQQLWHVYPETKAA